MAELGIHNNSIILKIDDDIQDFLLIDDSPQNNENNSLNEKQIIYFYLRLNKEISTEFIALIQCKKSRTLREVFLYFNKSFGPFDIISFIGLLRGPFILNPKKSFDELGIISYDQILMLAKQNIWIIDEHPLIIKDDNGNKFISKEQLNIIKILFIYNYNIIIIQCSKERKFEEIILYLDEVLRYKKEYVRFTSDEKESNKDKTLSELCIKDGNIIYLKDKDKIIHCCESMSTTYILQDKKKKEEKKYIAIIFIKNGKVIKFICKSEQTFKEISLKYMNESGEINQYNYFYNGKKILDENKTLNELNIKSFSKIIVTEN